ncbi:MAG: adenosine deaminase [Acidobacteriota bacterium]|nr:adenosine deaminase [Acidobacteriota bacterium]
MKRILRLAFVVLWAVSAFANERAAAQKLEKLRDSPLLLRRFLEAMPKGGDLHNHLSGAVYAESYLRWAVEDDLCIDRRKLEIAVPPCNEEDGLIPAKTAVRDSTIYSQIIDAMSVRNYKPAVENGHARFFSTFGRYRPVSRTRLADMLADVVGREARDNVDYLELMASLDASAARQIPLPEGATIEEMYALLDETVPGIVAQTRNRIDAAEAGMKKILRCDTATPRPGCGSTVRYIFEIHRGYTRTQVFAEMVVGFELAAADSRVVALNPVMPEDGWTSMNDFDEQMAMLRFLRPKYPKVRLTMHAGELAPGLVPPEGMRNHIRDSVMTAGAERIGHGVAIARETDATELLRTMAARQVAVEVCLTSNDVILGITGRHHPLRLYLEHGVPVVFATDDPGVSRGDLTTEFQRAVEEHGLNYNALKRAARNSLHYSFLGGASLWADASYKTVVKACKSEGEACRSYLDANPKARQQWHHEKRLREFENEMTDR